MKTKKAAPAKKVKKAPRVNWTLVGTCPTCVAPVFFAFAADGTQVHIWRTCNHNTPPQSSGSGGTMDTSGPSTAPEVPVG